MCMIDQLFRREGETIIVSAGEAPGGLPDAKTGAADVPKHAAIKLTKGEWGHARQIRAELQLRWGATFVEDCRPCDRGRLEASTLIRCASLEDM